MKIYKVGGAVRDSLLGYPHTETDWVVVGATPERLLASGFTQVGKDFPVFLHPDSKEEYALARTERKTGHGYHGFAVHAHPSVTLEEDLQRRDLTINAMAMTNDGTIIDPYNGRQDLNDRVLRHVSTHFTEDPLRVLRVARFAARYYHLGFTVAAETQALMAQIVDAGELAHLSAERIWVETERALTERDPAVYFQILNLCGALSELAPALCVTYGIDRLRATSHKTPRADCRWAALLVELPVTRVQDTCESLRAPNAFRNLAIKVAQWYPQMKSALREPEQCFALLKSLDALRRDEPYEGFVETLCALTPDTDEAEYLQHTLNQCRHAAGCINAQSLMDAGLTGVALGEAIKEQQKAAITNELDKR